MERDTASLVTGKKGGRGKLRDFMKKKMGAEMRELCLIDGQRDGNVGRAALRLNPAVKETPLMWPM